MDYNSSKTTVGATSGAVIDLRMAVMDRHGTTYGLMMSEVDEALHDRAEKLRALTAKENAENAAKVEDMRVENSSMEPLVIPDDAWDGN